MCNSSKLLPVIVYMHPGGFYSVSGRSDVAGPHYLLEKDVVYVALNYRLATLGVLALHYVNSSRPEQNVYCHYQINTFFFNLSFLQIF